MRWSCPVSKFVQALVLSGLLCLPCAGLPGQEFECLANISTGFDQDNDEPVPEGEADDDYEVDSGFGFESTFVVSSAGFPIPPWLDNTDECRWISSTFDTNAEPIDHIFEIGVELPDDVDGSKVSIVGRWAIDNSITDVIINEQSTGISGVGGFSNDFEFPSDDTLGFFEPGFNVIQFIVNNAPPNLNPLGLRVNACVGIVKAEERSLDLSTGFDDTGPSLIDPGNPDPDYVIVGPDGSGIGPAPATVSANGCGGGAWLPPRINSRWIGPEGDTCEGPEGEYVYRTEVTLPDDFEIDRAVIKGAGVAVDDELVDVLINEEPTGFTTFGSDAFQGFPVDFGRGFFVAGANLIEFVVRNNVEGVGGPATGLHVDAQVELGEPPLEMVPSLLRLDTGFNNDEEQVIANNEADDNWVVIGPDGSDIGPAAATVVNDGAFPIGPWIGSSEQSKWIGVEGAASNGPPGEYRFLIVVEVPQDVDADEVSIIGMASADNGGTDILINGVSVGIGITGAFDTLPPLPEDLGLGLFDNGENTVEILVSNAGDSVNPVGLRVEGTVGLPPPPPVPEPNPLNISTGFDRDEGLVLPIEDFVDVFDENYTYTTPDGDEETSLVVVDDDFPIPPWVANSATSLWIGVFDPDSNGPPGEYRFETSVELTANQADEAVIVGSWATDNAGVDLEINDISTGISAGGFDQFTPLPDDAGLGLFQEGFNNIVFIVSNAGDSPNPVGLRVDAVVDAGEAAPERTQFRRGDAGDTGSVNISSAVLILNFLFSDAVNTLACMDAGDVNNDGSINITDPVNLLNHLFGPSPPPAPPGLENCGEDPDAPGSPGDLGCETYTSC